VSQVVEFVFRFQRLVLVKWRRGDPFLMGAAIAYNSLFALVPLAIAFVSIVSVFDTSGKAIGRVVDLIESTLPPEFAAFLVGILEQSLGFVRDDQGLILGVSIAVALWSGSRAVYAVQKALRLVEGGDEDRGYLQTRVTGIIVTIAGGAAVLVGYAALLLGENAWGEISRFLGFSRTGQVQVLVAILALIWVFGLLWVVYRFGPPRPIPHVAVTTALVELVLVAGSRLAFMLLPGQAGDTLAVFGSIGIALVLLYFVGIVIIAGPIFVTSFWDAWSQSAWQYPGADDRGPSQDQGSQERDSTSPEGSR